MIDAWQILRDAGLPIAAKKSGRIPTRAAIADAVNAIVEERPGGREGEALCAFLLAWRHEWPRAFAEAFGERAEALADWARSGLSDANRYLKLRRLAIANLADVL